MQYRCTKCCCRQKTADRHDIWDDRNCRYGIRSRYKKLLNKEFSIGEPLDGVKYEVVIIDGDFRLKLFSGSLFLDSWSKIN